MAEELAAEAAPRKAKPRLGGASVWPDLQHEPAREDAPDKEQRHQRPGDQLHALGAVASGAAQCHPQGERDDRIAILDQQRRGEVEDRRSEEHTSELQSLMRISYAVFCLKKKTKKTPKR